MINHLYRRSLHRFFVFTVLLLALLPAPTLAQGHQDWSDDLGIYEVNVRQYTTAGTFAAFETHLDRLQEMGVGILWFMPIHPIGKKNRLGTLGSYYSVRDYLDVNPEFGTLDDFKALVQAVHDRGMYVIIDWVANHTAWDNPLTTEHPEWYAKDASGNFTPPPGTNWSDVIQLNYAQSLLRTYMIEAMKFWVEQVGVDGFRCDAVSFVPKDFWRTALAALKATKLDVFLLAEADGREWHDVGFDMTYGWGLYGFGSGVLKRIADRNNTAASLSSYAESEKATYPAGAYRMYFTSNHDENSWHGTPTELFGDAAEVFAVLTATFNGMPLIYSGQEAGLDKRLQFFDKDQIIWREHKNANLYATLLHLKKANRALWNGDHGGPLQRVLTSDNVNVYAFVREKDGDKVFVALNLSSQSRSVTLSGSAFVGTYQNVFADTSTTLNQGAVLSLPAWGYAVYAANEMNTGVATNATVPGSYALDQNYPNPFNTSTRISYALAAPSTVKLTMFDVLGRPVQTLALGTKQAGKYVFSVTPIDLPSGVYFYRLQAGSQTTMKRLILLR